MVQLQTTTDFEGEQSQNQSEPMIFDPLTEAYIPVSDLDSLLESYEALRQFSEQLYAAQIYIRRVFGHAAPTDTESRTRRVMTPSGKVVKVEFPGPSWDNSKLKEAYHAYPKFRDQYLRITKVDPVMKEVSKLEKMSGPDDLETFKTMVVGAKREPTGDVRISLEK